MNPNLGLAYFPPTGDARPVSERSATADLVQIVPRVPPALDGVGDYCRKLWEHWPVDRERWSCVTAVPVPGAQAAWPEVRIETVTAQSRALALCLQRLRARSVLLHYAGYGYHARGIPLWLAGGLTDWKRSQGGRLAVMFHELYHPGTPRQSAFWLRPWARLVVRRLLAAADAWVTSCPAYSERIQREWSADLTRGSIIPIGSNIVPATPPAGTRHEGPLRLVIFGLPNTRLWALEHHRGLLRVLNAQQRLATVTLLGKSDASLGYRSAIENLQLEVGGTWEEQLDLSPARVSAVLAGQDLGLLSNEPGTLTKSGVFAALVAHGVVPIVAAKRSRSAGVWDAGIFLNDDTQDVSVLSQAFTSGVAVAERRAELGKLAPELSWGKICQQWHALIETKTTG